MMLANTMAVKLLKTMHDFLNVPSASLTNGPTYPRNENNPKWCSLTELHRQFINSTIFNFPLFPPKHLSNLFQKEDQASGDILLTKLKDPSQKIRMAIYINQKIKQHLKLREIFLFKLM